MPIVTRMTASATPIPIPAFAPDDRLLEDVVTASVKLLSMDPLGLIRMAVGVILILPDPDPEPIVAVATHRSVESKAVHLAPSLQHPPPSNAGQLN